MRIYIDEGGTFHVPSERDYLFSVVTALVIPSSRQTRVFYDFMRLRDEWGADAIEIKGRELDETRFAQVIDILDAHDAVLEFVAIDMAWHSDSGLTEFKQHQARKLVESLTPKHQPSLVAEVNGLSAALARLPNQLFVQAYLTIELIERIVQTTTLYYSQRVPEELGQFDWVVDRKDRQLTEMERLWTKLIVPIGQTRAFKEPFITLAEGNYSHFDRFRIASGAGDQAKALQWLEDNIVFAKHPDEQYKIVDMKKVVLESLRFGDSHNELGLQLADIAASACRRAFNRNLRQSGWEKLGRLLVKRDGEAPIIGLATPQQALGRDRRLHHEPARVWLTLDAAAKSMWV